MHTLMLRLALWLCATVCVFLPGSTRGQIFGPLGPVTQESDFQAASVMVKLPEELTKIFIGPEEPRTRGCLIGQGVSGDLFVLTTSHRKAVPLLYSSAASQPVVIELDVLAVGKTGFLVGADDAMDLALYRIPAEWFGADSGRGSLRLAPIANIHRTAELDGMNLFPAVRTAERGVDPTLANLIHYDRAWFQPRRIVHYGEVRAWLANFAPQPRPGDSGTCLYRKGVGKKEGIFEMVGIITHYFETKEKSPRKGGTMVSAQGIMGFLKEVDYPNLLRGVAPRKPLLKAQSPTVVSPSSSQESGGTN